MSETSGKKQWTPEHLALAKSAEIVRWRLRRLLEKAPLEMRSELAECCNLISLSFKARIPLRKDPRMQRRYGGSITPGGEAA